MLHLKNDVTREKMTLHVKNDITREKMMLHVKKMLHVKQ